MFRITEQHAGGRLVLRLEGRCAGPWVDELDACWRMVADAVGREPIVVDLTGVCSVDAAGREQLARMFRGGARFVTTGCAMSEMVHEIAASSQLPAGSPMQTGIRLQACTVDLEAPRSTNRERTRSSQAREP